ncbi:MAG TPA: response regulator [Kofleriaceae bacterium]|nr:response regulator [Kofleriaceae bacterium]
MTGEQIILVVEDEPQMRRVLRTTLDGQGFRVIEAGSLADGMRAARDTPALVLLDLGLPDGDGLELVRWLRGWCRVPVIVISARGREADKVRVLDAGADDYLTKPFGVAELIARIRVALRHSAALGGPEEPVVEAGPIRVDFPRHEVTVDGVAVHLTPIEFRLLALLARHAGQVLTHRMLLREVWGPSAIEHTHYLRVHMATLRRKLEVDPARPHWLLTEPGVGYRLRDPGRAAKPT